MEHESTFFQVKYVYSHCAHSIFMIRLSNFHFPKYYKVESANNVTENYLSEFN